MGGKKEKKKKIGGVYRPAMVWESYIISPCKTGGWGKGGGRWWWWGAEGGINGRNAFGLECGVLLHFIQKCSFRSFLNGGEMYFAPAYGWMSQLFEAGARAYRVK